MYIERAAAVPGAANFIAAPLRVALHAPRTAVVNLSMPVAIFF